MAWYVERFELRKAAERSSQLRDLVEREGDRADLAIPETSDRYGNGRLAARYNYLRGVVAKNLLPLLVIDRTFDAPRGVAEIRPSVQVSLVNRPDKLVAGGAAVRYWVRQTATAQRHREVASSVIDYLVENMPATVSQRETVNGIGGVSLSDQRVQECNVLALVDMKSKNQPHGLMERLDDRGPVDQFLINGRSPIGLIQPNMDVHLYARRFEVEAAQ